MLHVCVIYCYFILTFYNSDHVDEDIQPYVCLSEECTAPLLFFTSMKQWIDHMNFVHSKQWTRNIHTSTWYCHIGHQETSFYDLESFVEHMKAPRSHPGREPPSDLQVDTLSRTKQRLSIREDEYSCILCDCVPDELKPIIPTSDSEEILHKLHTHIASHVKELALLSIPAIDITNVPERNASEVYGWDGGRWLKDGENASFPSGFDEQMQAISLTFSESPTHIPLPDVTLRNTEDGTTQYEFKEHMPELESAQANEGWNYVFEYSRQQKNFPSLEDDQTLASFRNAWHAIRHESHSSTEEFRNLEPTSAVTDSQASQPDYKPAASLDVAPFLLSRDDRSDSLCLLSLDGGGVRGLSTLYILRNIMARLNQARRKMEPPLPAVKPCDVFDLIGGTSTGGFVLTFRPSSVVPH